MKKVKKRLELNKTLISSLNAHVHDQTRKIVGGDETDGCFCTIEPTDCIQIGCGTSAPTWTDGPSEPNICWPYTIPYICDPGGGSTWGCGGGTGDPTNSWNPLYCY